MSTTSHTFDCQCEACEADLRVVTVTVEGGVVQHVDVPPGVRVKIMDFDVDGVPPHELSYTPKDGSAYVSSLWDAP
jgi:hypothetical protein